MTKQCSVTNKLPMAGNSVSHAHNKKRKRFLPNLHSHRFWHPTQNRFIRLKVSAKAIRIIDKYGLEAVLDSMLHSKKLRRQGEEGQQEMKTSTTKKPSKK